MTKNTLVLFLLFLFPYLFQSANSKNTSPYFFTQIGVEDGLTQGTVTNIYQDTDGYLWLGTQGGLHRYDGYEFKVFKNNPTDSCSLTDNNVLDIGEDKNKNIWAVSYTHLFFHFPVVFSSILFLSFFACKVLENQKANIGLTDTASPIFCQ